MTNLKAIIVDEERLARVNMRRLLEPFPEITIAGEAGSCESALELVNLKNPQLIFLDIQLHGETCYDLLKLIDNSINIIFVTAFDENAIHIFNMNSVGYLSKPVNPEQLKIVIERIKDSGNNPIIETHIYEYSDGTSVVQNNIKCGEKPKTINMASLKKQFITKRRQLQDSLKPNGVSVHSFS